jgi:hypothetical protein
VAVIAAFTLVSYRYVEQPARRAARAGRIRRGSILLAGPVVLLAGAAASAMLVQAQGRLTLTVPAPSSDFSGAANCAPRREEKSFANGSLTRWQPCRDAAPRLFVLGDSHARFYEPLFRRYAAEAGGQVVRYYRNTCPFPPLWPSVEQARRCSAFTHAAIGDIAREAKPGDIIFATGRRMASNVPAPRSRIDRIRAAAVTARLMQPLAATHARIIIEAPKPVLPSPPGRCLAWFNRSNPVCRGGIEAPRSSLLLDREWELAGLQQVAAALPRAQMWDPFPLLCPSDPCRATRAGKLLYLDMHHLAPDASLLLWPEFKALLVSPSSGAIGSEAH